METGVHQGGPGLPTGVCATDRAQLVHRRQFPLLKTSANANFEEEI